MTRVYRLAITYPAGSRTEYGGTAEDWKPAAWTPGDPGTVSAAGEWSDETAEFRWPRERLYLSASSARRRADLLRAYGCAVEVHASDPVTWTGEAA